MNARVERLRAALQAALQPQALEIEDESHLHAGHAGARSGKGHFRVHIVADAFSGKSPVERHRMVYAALGHVLHNDVHALGITAKAPGEA